MSQAARQTSHLSWEFPNEMRNLAAEVPSTLFWSTLLVSTLLWCVPCAAAAHLSWLFLVEMRFQRKSKFDAATLHRHPDFMFSDTSFELAIPCRNEIPENQWFPTSSQQRPTRISTGKTKAKCNPMKSDGIPEKLIWCWYYKGNWPPGPTCHS